MVVFTVILEYQACKLVQDFFHPFRGPENPKDWVADEELTLKLPYKRHIWVVVKIMVPFWVPQILGAVL